MHVRLMVLATLGLLALAGCKVDLSVEVPVRDLQEIVAATDPTTMIMTTATVRFEVPSASYCQEHAAEFVTQLSAAFQAPRNPACRDGFPAQVEVTVDLPLLQHPATATGTALYLVARARQIEEADAISVAVAANPDMVAQLNRQLSRRHMHGLNPDDIRLNLVINNDSRQPVPARWQAAFGGGRPSVMLSPWQPPRDRLTVRLGDVVTQQALAGQPPFPVVAIRR